MEKKRSVDILFRLESLPSMQAIRKGFVMSIPVLLVGAFTLVINSLPFPWVQTFLDAFAGGILRHVLNGIYNVTFNLLTIVVALNISLAYAQMLHRESDHFFLYGSPLATVMVLCILSGYGSTTFKSAAFGVQGILTAILSALFVTKFYVSMARSERFTLRTYADGSDASFNNALSFIVPLLLLLLMGTLFDFAVEKLFHVENTFDLITGLLNGIFANMGRNFPAAFLMVFLSTLLWFFGIHGSNVLENAMANIFTPAIDENIAVVAAGAAPTQIFTKTFFDVFVLMGGCGAAICLLFSILLFAKRSNTRSLSRMAAIPMIFNINELMIFGLPVVLNPTMLIPFLLTPVVCLLTSYLAMASGLVPLTISSVTWTTPVLIGGYLATGSLWGSALQLVNLVLGMLIYRPFVLRYEREKNENVHEKLNLLVESMKAAEADTLPISFTTRNDGAGELARMLLTDLNKAIENHALSMYYQPQHDNSGKCVGMEALLRYDHPTFGMLYPPLVIQLAHEGGKLSTLERSIFEMVAADCAVIQRELGYLPRVSINISSESLEEDSFESFLRQLVERYPLESDQLCIEITEQMTLHLGIHMEEKLARLRQMGILLAIDDFSMGHTSLSYLQSQHFNILKLDGSLVQGMAVNPRCADIISSIVYLSNSLHFTVLAEFVETKTERDALRALGCEEYQGYLYSKAISRKEFIAYMRNQTICKP